MDFKARFPGALLLSSALGLAATSAVADAVGFAVGSVGGSSQVGVVANSAVLGGPAIQFYIPLNGNSGTYGTGFACLFSGNHGFGTCSDSGNGGGTLTMILRFDPVSTTAPSVLHVRFDDLDLIGANDPAQHLESLNVLKSDGVTSLTGLITNITSTYFTQPGNNSEQDLTLALGVLPSSPLFLELKFQATETDGHNRSNTAEFLTASISSVPGPIVGAGLPGLIFAAGGVLAWCRGRRKGVAAIAAA